MKIVIFGGTSEGRELSNKLAKAGAEVLVSVASNYGAEEQGTADGVTVAQGAKDEEEICQMIKDADVVVDATHPFAVIVTDNIRSAAEKTGALRLRLLRDESPLSAPDMILRKPDSDVLEFAIAVSRLPSMSVLICLRMSSA